MSDTYSPRATPGKNEYGVDMLIYEITHGMAVSRLDEDGDITIHTDEISEKHTQLKFDRIQFDGHVRANFILVGDMDIEFVVNNGAEGNATRRGAGDGDVTRKGSGNGDARRYGCGKGDAIREGLGNGDAYRGGRGIGNAYRIGHGVGRSFKIGSGLGSAYQKHRQRKTPAIDLNNRIQ